MKTAIIIIHFGKLQTTQACIKSVMNVEKRLQKIILVNNDQIMLKKSDFGNTRKITIINNKKNVGFAAGVNIGIKYALKSGFDNVLLLNNDTILTKPIVERFIEDLKEHKTIAIVGPVLEFTKKGKKLYDLGGYVNMLFGKTKHDNCKKVPFEVLQFPDYISGCCMLITKEVFKKIGYFDERFFLYYEDVDFCLRARKVGFTIALDPRIILFHGLSKAVGKGSKVTLFHQTKSALLFGKKYFRNSVKRVFNVGFVFLQSLVFIKNNGANGLAALQAMKEAF